MSTVENWAQRRGNDSAERLRTQTLVTEAARYTAV